MLKTLGVDELRVPRKYNPFAVARHIKKLSAGTGGNLPELRAMLVTRRSVPMSPSITSTPTEPAVPTNPDSTSEPREAVAA